MKKVLFVGNSEQMLQQTATYLITKLNNVEVGIVVWA